MTELEKAFKHWQAMADLQVQFVEALGEHKLQTAKAELVRAVAAQNWAVARMKHAVATELETSLKRLRRQRHRTRGAIERLGRHAKAAAKIRSGEDLPASQLSLMWAGYTVFERLVPATVLEDLMNTSLHASARQGRSYVDPRQPDRPCPDPPQEVDNLLALIAWLRRHRLVPRRGTHAYQQVIGGFAKIAAVATTEIETLNANFRALEQDTYGTWQPIIIAALPESLDVKKIIRLK